MWAVHGRGRLPRKRSTMFRSVSWRPGPSRAVPPQVYDSALMRTLFDYVRRGHMVDALDLCRRVRQPWRAAAMRGALFYRDADLGATWAATRVRVSRVAVLTNAAARSLTGRWGGSTISCRRR